jgi:hypothetical protein
MKIIPSKSKQLSAYDKDFLTAQQGSKDAKHDNNSAWVEPSEWTEKELREHMSVAVDASPDYIDAYVKEMFKLGLKK